jgi:uncharacterized membrane protein YpjA
MVGLICLIILAVVTTILIRYCRHGSPRWISRAAEVCGFTYAIWLIIFLTFTFGGPPSQTAEIMVNIKADYGMAIQKVIFTPSRASELWFIGRGWQKEGWFLVAEDGSHIRVTEVAPGHFSLAPWATVDSKPWTIRDN